jgi:hypothetical protein
MNMNILELKKFGVLDIILLALFVIYIVFPVQSPQWLVPLIDSPFGMLVMFVVTLSLFVYRSPILGVLYIFVAYELLRRNHHSAPSSPDLPSTEYVVNREPKAIPTQAEKNAELQTLNPLQSGTLEEEIVAKETPVGVSQLPIGMETSFHPANDKSSLGMSIA